MIELLDEKRVRITGALQLTGLPVASSTARYTRDVSPKSIFEGVHAPTFSAIAPETFAIAELDFRFDDEAEIVVEPT
jgi:hypothetical protein